MEEQLIQTLYACKLFKLKIHLAYRLAKYFPNSAKSQEALEFFVEKLEIDFTNM